MIVSVGCIGIGLVWGWLLAKLPHQFRRPRMTITVLLAATALVGIQVYTLSEVRALALFLGAAVLAFFIHLMWRESLLLRFGSRP